MNSTKRPSCSGAMLPFVLHFVLITWIRCIDTIRSWNRQKTKNRRWQCSFIIKLTLEDPRGHCQYCQLHCPGLLSMSGQVPRVPAPLHSDYHHLSREIQNSIMSNIDNGVNTINSIFPLPREIKWHSADRGEKKNPATFYAEIDHLPRIRLPSAWPPSRLCVSARL